MIAFKFMKQYFFGTYSYIATCTIEKGVCSYILYTNIEGLFVIGLNFGSSKGNLTLP